MSRILIAFDTRDGQCEKIAYAMADIVEILGHKVLVENLNTKSLDLAGLHLDGVIVGGPIYAGRFTKGLRKFLNVNRASLSDLSTAFFSVSLSAAGTSDQREDALKTMNRFLASLAFAPAERVSLAGALKYRKYGFLKRLMMKWMASLNGGDTDTSRDHEYTNWETVSHFVESFLTKAGIESFGEATYSR